MFDSTTTIYLFLFFFTLGLTIGALMMDLVYRNRHKKLWVIIEKSISKTKLIEKKFVDKPKNSINDYPKININIIYTEVLDINDRLEKIWGKIKNIKFVTKDKENGMDKPTIKRHSDDEDMEKALNETKPNEPITTTLPTPTNEPQSDYYQNDYKKSKFEPRDLASRIVNLYNQGVSNRTARNDFWEEYSITRIGNDDAVAQRMGEVSEPDFRESTNGDFLAIQNDDNRTYLVVPLFDTTVTSSTYNEGGIGFAFNCQNYDPEISFSKVIVRSPAVFRLDGAKWLLENKGTLILQN